MKQKTILNFIVILLIVVFTFLGTNFVYAAEGDNQTTIMNFEKVEGKEKIKLSMDISGNEGVSSFQTSLKLATNQLSDIKDVTIVWGQTIQSKAILKNSTYNKDTGVLNIYVVSKTELTEVTDKGDIVLEIGTISFSSDNTSEMKVGITAGKTVLGDIAHNSREITANENTEKIELIIASKQTQVNPDNPNNPNNPSDPNNPGGTTQNPGDNSNGNGDQNSNGSQTGDQNGEKQEGKDSQEKDKYNGILPFTGLLRDHKIAVLITLAILVAITVVIIKKRKTMIK